MNTDARTKKETPRHTLTHTHTRTERDRESHPPEKKRGVGMGTSFARTGTREPVALERAVLDEKAGRDGTQLQEHIPFARTA